MEFRNLTLNGKRAPKCYCVSHIHRAYLDPDYVKLKQYKVLYVICNSVVERCFKILKDNHGCSKCPSTQMPIISSFFSLQACFWWSKYQFQRNLPFWNLRIGFTVFPAIYSSTTFPYRRRLTLRDILRMHEIIQEDILQMLLLHSIIKWKT